MVLLALPGFCHRHTIKYCSNILTGQFNHYMKLHVFNMKGLSLVSRR